MWAGRGAWGDVSGGWRTSRDVDGACTLPWGVQVGVLAMPIREHGGCPAALLSLGHRDDVGAGGACLIHDAVVSAPTPTWRQHQLQGPGCVEAHPVYMLCSITDIAACAEGTVGQHEAGLGKRPSFLVESGETTWS